MLGLPEQRTRQMARVELLKRSAFDVKFELERWIRKLARRRLRRPAGSSMDVRVSEPTKLKGSRSAADSSEPPAPGSRSSNTGAHG